MFSLKIIVSAFLIASISELGRRNTLAAAFFAALPLVSILSACWVYWETRDNALVGCQLEATVWLVLPSLPMFLAVPAAIRAGFTFPVALAGGVSLTVLLYAISIWLLTRLGAAL